MQYSIKSTSLIWSLLWLSILSSFVIFLPGFSEYDTSKYLAIAQQMLQKHHYLTASWQGHTYSDKPPLFFWLIILGWKLFGFSTWWPQLLVLLLATASIILTQQIARLLWPQDTTCSQLIPFILIGCFYWVWFAKEIRVDAILVFATLLSLYALMRSIQGSHKYWLVYVLAIGLGAFAKGPVILVFILLPGIFLPSMLCKGNSFSPKWYALLGLATILGLCIPLTWVIPAILSSNKAFMQEILFQQIAHRAHQQHLSIFFYLLRLPLWLLPWSIYPPTWRGIKSLRFFTRPSGEGICLIIIICGMITFSVFGQKLPHYLYPLFPIFALLIARLCMLNTIFSYRDQWPMAGLIFILGLFCISYPYISHWLPQQVLIRGFFLHELPLSLWGGIFVLLGLLVFMWRCHTRLTQIILITICSVIIALFVNNSMLFHYTSHLKNTALYTLLKQLPTQQVIVITPNQITDQALVQYIQQQHYTQISAQQWAQQPHTSAAPIWLLTTQFTALKQHYPTAWFYQTRFEIVGLQKY